MGKDVEVTPTILRELLNYNPETGGLTWRFRDRKWFTCDRGFKIWNKKYPDGPAFTNQSGGYLKGRVFYNYFFAHRVAWAIHFGEWPQNQIDHINGDGTDNRLINIRDVPPAINSQNRAVASNNSSGVCGVSWHKSTNRWRAYIGRGKNRIWIGRFDKFEDAVAARKQAEIDMEYHENHGRDKS